ncbi:TPA-induced transmembrane protein [Austrofundulus limnaeus]|uniref:TPA-induced transmembrane protein n=1 Tax=Austrofundulus limnaeus TaxID=52670 RepID=A0A2I4BKE9_AUSLI|nr:PREDICTED: TPA-induced transmembrane protein [Austrofundulus limnaeus]XP_013868226.1 PREDICTED: TPA-induced transmembrane protein [Austrofundulus limnaeus]
MPPHTDCTSNEAEHVSFLNEQGDANNVGSSPNNVQIQMTHDDVRQPKGWCHWIKKELNEKVYRECRVWMLIPVICAVIVAVILISMAVCAALHEDEDEKFDRSLFTVPRHFNGSFQISSQPVSNETQVLVDLQDKLSDLYKSSPALGRYFSQAHTFPFRNESAVVLYQLTFVLPEEQQEELRNFTLSLEVVRNVLRQFLYDQDPGDSGSAFIDPASLKMS